MFDYAVIDVATGEIIATYEVYTYAVALAETLNIMYYEPRYVVKGGVA